MREKNKHREYSSLFSRKAILELFHNDNYEFFNEIIETYDSDKVGSKFDTYYDYLCYSYKIISRDYQNEYYLKNSLIKYLIFNDKQQKSSTILNEFRVGKSIADVVLVNDVTTIFEMKSVLDSRNRLRNQINDYLKLFNKVYVLVHESKLKSYYNIDQRVGIVCYNNINSKFHIDVFRESEMNLSIKPKVLISSLRMQEYLQIVEKYYGSIPNVSNLEIFETCLEFIMNIPVEELNSLFVDVLKKRKKQIHLFRNMKKELRQVTLSLNFTKENYIELFGKLSKPIRM